jgi:hypothetical protein
VAAGAGLVGGANWLTGPELGIEGKNTKGGFPPPFVYLLHA